MVINSLDELGYDELREVGLHGQMERAVKARYSYEIAHRLELLTSDEGRLGLVRELNLGAYRGPNGKFYTDCGLVMEWEKFDNIFVPKRWNKYMHDDAREWNFSFTGILSTEEVILNPSSMEEQIFNETILSLPSRSHSYFFVFYSEWRERVMSYAKWRLDSISEALKGKKPGYKDDELTRRYVSLIKPLVEKYRAEVNSASL